MTVQNRLLLATLALSLAAAAQAEVWKQGYSRQAVQVLARGRAAAGGAGWNFLRGWHETGRENGSPYEAWYDPLRYGMRVERREAAGTDTHGFNGQGAWRITPAGVASGTGEAGPVGAARSEAFFGMHAYFFAGRFDAAGRYLGARRADGASFEAVEVKPYGGPGRELWFDRRTGLLAREVARTGARTVTTEFSDYRKVGPVRVAFRAVTDDSAGGRTERVVESISFMPADRALFSLARPEGAVAKP